MSLTRWSLIRFVHVLAAMGWVGGQLLLSAVVLPVLRTAVEPGLRGPLVHQTAKRFGLMANFVLLPLLAAMGLALAWHRGVTFGGSVIPATVACSEQNSSWWPRPWSSPRPTASPPPAGLVAHDPWRLQDWCRRSGS